MTAMMPVLPLVFLAAVAAPAGAADARPAPKAPAITSTTPRTPVVRAESSGPDRAPTPLATAADLARLCAALDPAERLRVKGDAVARGEAEARQDAEHDAAVTGRYEVVTPATGLAFAPYDGPERRLALVEPVQIPVAGGVARLWPTEERSLAVEADAAVARRVIDAQRAGRLTLGLVFDLGDDAACGKGARGQRFTVPVEPVSWRWMDGDVVLAHGGAAVDRPLLTVAQGARPRVDVGEPIAGPPEAKKVILARAADLEACYAEALKRDPQADGVLVADLGGARPAISADSVGDPDLARCVQQALAPLAPAAGRLAVPIRFVLEAPGIVRPATRAE
jgi:hypothetical protein